jgi:hypothetical protein
MGACTRSGGHGARVPAGFLQLHVREDTLLQLLAGRQLTAEDLRAAEPDARRQLRRLLLASLRGS